MSEAEQRYADLVIELVDSNDGVTEVGGDLLVHGGPFARLVGDELSVRLPPDRVEDLRTRGIVRRHHGEWVLVEDQSIWSEMARESHELSASLPSASRASAPSL